MHLASSHHLNVGHDLRNLPGCADRKFYGPVLCLYTQLGQTLTDNPEDAQDVRSEDNQQVDASEQANGNECVPQPIELLVLKQHLLDGTAHLDGGVGGWEESPICQLPLAHPALVLLPTPAHRKQNDWHGERDRCEHGHTHAEDQHVKRVHLAVGVQELRLHSVCGRQGGWSAAGPGRGVGSEPGLTLTLWGVATDSPPQLQGTIRQRAPT